METVKVDIQKLQLLNDRIAQTIEALNQVRLSVHGIQHTPYGLTPSPFAAYQTSPYMQYASPFAAMGVSPFGQFSPYGQGFVPGIQHTTAGIPFAGPSNPYGQAIPFTAQSLSQPVGVSSSWSLPYASNGLSHSSWDPRQAFPFAQYPYAQAW